MKGDKFKALVNRFHPRARNGRNFSRNMFGGMRFYGALTLFFLLMAGKSYAANGTFYASGLTAPGGAVWVNKHLWVSDHVQGFCRMDPAVPPATGFAINPNTCAPNALTGLAGPTSPGQPTFDSGHKLIYVPDNSIKSQGVWRLTWDPATETILKAELLAPTGGVGLNKPTATALGPDGKLYVGFIKSGNIVRITNPSGLSQTVEPFGNTSDLRGVSGIAFVGPNLYLAEGTKVSMIGPLGGAGMNTPLGLLAPTAIASDGKNVLYIANTPIADSTIIRFTISTKIPDVYSINGVLPNATTTPYQFASGLSVDPSGSLFIADDPTDGLQVLMGRIWTVPAGSKPDIAGTTSALPPAAMKTGTFYASGLTSPGGQIWAGTHLWVSDHLQGFCRMDPLALPATGFAINPNTCAPNALTGLGGPASPGQPTYDAPNNFIYVPDNSIASRGVWRLTFDPATETISRADLLAPNAGLGANKPTASALGPDGKLYVGFIKNGNIVRITNPTGLTQTVESFGKTSDGRGVNGIAFAGPNLYLAEKAKVSMIGPLGGGGVNSPIVSFAPTAITSAIDALGGLWIFVADTPLANSNVIRYSVSLNFQDNYANTGVFPNLTTTPFKFVSGLVMDPLGSLFVADDPSGGAQALQGRMWSVVNVFDDPCEYGNCITRPVYSIRGTEFNDSNGNKMQDPDEEGLAGRTIKLEGFDKFNKEFVSRIAVSDDSGNYEFEDVMPGNYTVRAVREHGWVATTPAAKPVKMEVDEIVVDFGSRSLRSR